MYKVVGVSLLVLFSCYVAPKPRILVIGDSISIGYFSFVKEALAAKADVYHNAGNAQHTATGLEKIQLWLGEGHWDVIQFNWGLWDIAYRNPESNEQGNRDKQHGTIAISPEKYRENLESLVVTLKRTGAKLIFVTTTVVPKKEAGRFVGDEERYNKIAREVMKKNGILINELYTPSLAIHAKFGMGDDNVHYTKEGYQQLSKPIIAELERTLHHLK
jgi:hypothetical protein